LKEEKRNINPLQKNIKFQPLNPNPFEKKIKTLNPKNPVFFKNNKTHYSSKTKTQTH